MTGGDELYRILHHFCWRFVREHLSDTHHVGLNDVYQGVNDEASKKTILC